MKQSIRPSFLITPSAITLGLFATWIAILVLPGALLLVIFSVVIFPFAIFPAIGVVLLVFFLWRRHPVSGIMMVFGIIALVLLASVPRPSDSIAKLTANYVQLMIYRGSLQRQARALERRSISPPIASIAVDGFVGMTSGFAYDPTGEILLPPDKRSKAWNAVAAHTDLDSADLQAKHIYGSYYAWFHD